MVLKCVVFYKVSCLPRAIFTDCFVFTIVVSPCVVLTNCRFNLLSYLQSVIFYQLALLPIAASCNNRSDDLPIAAFTRYFAKWYCYQLLFYQFGNFTKCCVLPRVAFLPIAILKQLLFCCKLVYQFVLYLLLFLLIIVLTDCVFTTCYSYQLLFVLPIVVVTSPAVIFTVMAHLNDMCLKHSLISNGRFRLGRLVRTCHCYNKSTNERRSGLGEWIKTKSKSEQSCRQFKTVTKTESEQSREWLYNENGFGPPLQEQNQTHIKSNSGWETGKRKCVSPRKSKTTHIKKRIVAWERENAVAHTYVRTKQKTYQIESSFSCAKIRSALPMQEQNKTQCIIKTNSWWDSQTEQLAHVGALRP